VLLANGEASIRAAMQLTKAVPVIFIGSGDPVEEGLVKAAAHGFAVTIDFAPARHRLPTILALRAVGADGGRPARAIADQARDDD